MMIAPDEARAELERIKEAEWRTRAIERITSLESLEAGWATALIDPLPPYQRREAVEAAVERRQVAFDRLEELDDDARSAVLRACHPELGADLARWWVAARSMTYSRDIDRRAARAPNHPGLTLRHRGHALCGHLKRFGPYRRDLGWVAEWSAHLTRWADIGHLLASAIDAGNEDGAKIRATLIEASTGRHHIAAPSHSSIRGLLCSGDTAAWEAVERLLLAAQRQEGLRQVILEAVDEAHPEAFRRMLTLIVEERLVRFAATIRAVSVWVGVPLDATKEREVTSIIERLLQLHDVEEHERALASSEPIDVHLALLTTARTDESAAIDAAAEIVETDDRSARRHVAASFLARTRLERGRAVLAEALVDDDLAVAAIAFGATRATDDVDHFDAIETLLHRWPDEPVTVRPLPLSGLTYWVERADLARSLVALRGDRPVDRVIPWIDELDVSGRAALARSIEDGPTVDAADRETLLGLLGDRSSTVRRAAIAALDRVTIDSDDAMAIESLLTRRASDLRRGVLQLLATLPPDEIAESAGRLWSSRSRPQRDAAAELLTIAEPTQAVRDSARRLLADAPTDEQTNRLRSVADSTEEPSVEEQLGLVVTQDLSPRPRPTARLDRVYASPAANRLVTALDELLHEHRDVEVRVPGRDGEQMLLLGDVRFAPHPAMHRAEATTPSGMLLADVIDPWWERRDEELRDPDGHDVLRAYVALARTTATERARGLPAPTAAPWRSDAIDRLLGSPTLGPVRYLQLVLHVLIWKLHEQASTTMITESIDAFETVLAAVPEELLTGTQPPPDDDPDRPTWRHGDFRHHLSIPWKNVLGWLFSSRPSLFDDETFGRYLHLLRWLDRPIDGAVSNHQLTYQHVLEAHRRGIITDSDLIDELLPRGASGKTGADGRLTPLTRLRRDEVAKQFPDGIRQVDRIRDRILEIERDRGDLPTAATWSARRLGSIHGADVVIDLLAGLDRAALVRGRSNPESKESTFSHLLTVSYPSAEDSPKRLIELATARSVPPKRLVELAMFAPQWVELLEEALDWPGLAEAVWWVHAHTKDRRWTVATEVRETWAFLSGELTQLEAEDRLDGAVDVGWFEEAHATLGPDRWAIVHGAAKLTSSGSGHRRAQMYAEAMLGELTEDTLAERIRSKRSQDAVRALGLVPLPAAARGREQALLRRYALLREFERGSTKFGSQRRTSEQTAVRIGLDNLARSAGYADPQRFAWAMEAQEIADLATGPIVAEVDGVRVTLSVDDEGVPSLDVHRGAKRLTSVPAKVRKDPAIAELRERKTALTKQVARVRRSLEEAMVRREVLSPADLLELDAHPIVAPMLRLLVLVDEDGHVSRSAGDAPPERPVRIAHPHDLLASGSWAAAQADLIDRSSRQPFKQVFRELYAPTDEERASTASVRYAGHQVQPAKGRALLTGRGWLLDRYEASASRSYHHDRVIARLEFRNDLFSPAEVELPVLDRVRFTHRGQCTSIPVDEVPPIVFSETMRDLDLLVSVAHAGGVDPEASASTIEMRAALAHETIRALGLDNVVFTDHHAIIDGSLAQYSLHLGSGLVHRRPGQAVVIVPVHSQRRGRVFLPFADDDPMTAEILSKLLLLARDDQVTDPTIIAQLV